MGGHADREFEDPAPWSGEPEPLGADDPFGEAEFLSVPGWYTIDYRRNVQAFWDGSMWSRTRRWRGVGWFEDEPSSLLAPAAGVDVLAKYPPASVVSPPPGPSRRPPSLVRVRAERSPARAPAPAPAPVVARTNGTAVASFVLALVGLLGVGSVLGIIFGYRARREIRRSRGAQRGDRLALAAIVIGFCTLALFLVVLTLGLVGLSSFSSRVSSAIDGSLLAAPTQLTPQATQIADLQCQADVRTVEVAVSAYQVQMGAHPVPPKPWSAGTYAANYAPLTSGVGGGPWLSTAPGTDAYVVEYDAAGNVWVAPPGTYEASYHPGRGSGSAGACHVAVAAVR